MDVLISSVITGALTLCAAAGAWLTARRMGKLGLGPAQQKLNETLKETNDAYAERIEQLEESDQKKTREIARLERVVADLRRERRDLKQDVDDLRQQVRELRAQQEKQA